MSNPLRTALRIASFRAQNGKCFYCQKDMWELSEEARVVAYRRMHGLPDTVWKRYFPRGWKAEINNRRCTAEHLRRQCQGGIDTPSNIVAACFECNTQRQEATPEAWKAIRSCA